MIPIPLQTNLGEIIVNAVFSVFGQVGEDFTTSLEMAYENLGEALFGTPTPETPSGFVMGQPTNAPWTGIYETLVGGEIMLIALVLLLISVQGRHLLRIFDIGSVYRSRKTRQTAWAGGALIVAWYWIAALLLYLVEGFTLALLPDLTTLGALLAEFAVASANNPAFGILAVGIGGLFMWVFKGLMLLRELLLYIYIYGMPIIVALAFANLPILSDIATGFARKFVPLAVLPIPAVLLFQGLAFLQRQGILGAGLSSFLQLFLVMTIPIIALWLTWVTFKYASPLTAKVIGTTTKGAAWLGTVATAAYLGGPRIGGTAARWGSKAAAAHGLAHKIGYEEEEGGIPEYRRAENDPAYQ